MSYVPAVAISLLIHGLIMLFIFSGWRFGEPPEPVKPPSYIKATLLNAKSTVKQPTASKPDPVVKPPPEPVVDVQEIERQRLQERLEKQKQISLAKAEKEKAEKLKLEKEKKAKQKKLEDDRKKKLKEEQERKQKQKREEELAKQRERFQSELQADLLAEQAEASDARANSYIALIQQRIEQNWSRPPSARNDMQADLTIQMVPTGDIIDVVLKKSSGNSAFDRSAIQAVKKTGRIPEMKDLPTRDFERKFRQFTLTFKPQDLRQ